MLDAYIIDAIQEEERARERARQDAARIHLEIPAGGWEVPNEPEPEPEADRGVVVIPLYAPNAVVDSSI